MHRPKNRTTGTNLIQGQQPPTSHRDDRHLPRRQDDRHRPHTGTTGTNHIPGWENTCKKRTPPQYKERHWSEGILRTGINDAGKIVRSANENATSHGGKSQGIEHDRCHGSSLREQTVRGGKAGLREERNKEVTSKKERQLTQLPFQKLTN